MVTDSYPYDMQFTVRIALNFWGRKLHEFCDSKWNHENLVTQGKDEWLMAQLHESFITEFLPQKFGAIRYTGPRQCYHDNINMI